MAAGQHFDLGHDLFGPGRQQQALTLRDRWRAVLTPQLEQQGGADFVGRCDEEQGDKCRHKSAGGSEQDHAPVLEPCGNDAIEIRQA